MRIAITGSSGQIGTNVALALLARDDEVVGLDRRRNEWTDRFPTELVDLSSCPAGELPLRGKFDAVLHLAAYAKVFELVEHPLRALENVTMLYCVLEYCRRTGTPILFGSSREVYGDIQHFVTDEAKADFIVAESPYSASKISGEAFIYSYATCYDLPCLVFRFSNVYGRYDCDLQRMERVIPLFIRKILRDEPIVVFGRQKVLDFTYIDDCVDGVIRGIDAVVARNVTRDTINLAFGQGATLVDVVNLAALALNRQPQVRYEPARPGEIARYVADLSKARKLLGYDPQTPLTAGIPRAIQWQREAGHLEP